MKTLTTKEEVLQVLKEKGITVRFGHSNFAYKQSGINTAQAIKNNLQQDKWVSIIWNSIPKIHIKKIKELIKELDSYEVEDITEINSITPAHTLYIK